jgi:hypothetical protein
MFIRGDYATSEGSDGSSATLGHLHRGVVELRRAAAMIYMRLVELDAQLCHAVAVKTTVSKLRQVPAITNGEAR